MKFGSLFAGIGGFDLGLERAGMECVWQVEIDPWCRKVLEKHWPNVKRYEDVRTVGKHNLEPVDLICGGFPCQDISNAGKRAGIDGERSGLWSEFHRIICELRPRIVLVENVAALAIRGLDRVLGDLAGIGFDAEWSCISACSMGTAFVRQRMFIVAFPASERQGQLRWIECTLKGDSERHLRWSEAESRIPRELDAVPDRVERLTALGNAVVPQVAEWIGRRIMEAQCSQSS